MMRLLRISLLLTFSAISACTVSTRDDAATAAADSAAAVPPAVAPPMTMPLDSSAMIDTTATTMRIEVDLSKRKLSLFNGTDTAETYSVAVGSQRWPTQTGEWKITQLADTRRTTGCE